MEDLEFVEALFAGAYERLKKPGYIERCTGGTLMKGIYRLDIYFGPNGGAHLKRSPEPYAKIRLSSTVPFDSAQELGALLMTLPGVERVRENNISVADQAPSWVMELDEEVYAYGFEADLNIRSPRKLAREFFSKLEEAR